jgi:chaperonin GroES
VAKRLIPLLDRVLIQKAEAVTKTKGGIVIPEKAQAKVLRGTVVAVGPGARNKVYDTPVSLPATECMGYLGPMFGIMTAKAFVVKVDEKLAY